MVELNALSASCAIDAFQTQMEFANGEIHDSADVIVAKQGHCVDDGKRKGRDIFKLAVPKTIRVRPEIEAVYTAWLVYMDRLGNPLKEADQRAASRQLDVLETVLEAQWEAH